MEEIQALNERKVEDLNHSIDIGLRIASVFLIIPAVIVIGLLIFSIILIIEETHFLYSINNDMAISMLSAQSGFLAILGICINIVSGIRKKRIDFNTNKFIYFILFLLSSCLIIGMVLTTVYSVIWIASGKLVGLVGETASLLVGIILEVFELFVLVGSICLLVSCCKIIKKYKIEYSDDIKKYEERRQQLARQQAIKKQQEKDLDTVDILLSKAGNKFFVKYYYQLRDWADPDIIDIIQENYSEETKIQRIRNAKEIFNKHLNKLALQRIADVENISVDEETKQKAKELLEKII